MEKINSPMVYKFSKTKANLFKKFVIKILPTSYNTTESHCGFYFVKKECVTGCVIMSKTRRYPWGDTAISLHTPAHMGVGVVLQTNSNPKCQDLPKLGRWVTPEQLKFKVPRCVQCPNFHFGGGRREEGTPDQLNSKVPRSA